MFHFKREVKLMIRALSLYLFIFSFTVAAETPQVIRLGSKVEWAPYHINTPHGSDGIAVRALACIMSRINQPFIIHKLPWKRAQEETKAGTLDGFFSASRNEDRDVYATLSKVFLPQERIFYTLKENISVPLEKYTLEYILQNISVGARFGSNTLHSLKKGNYIIGATPHTQSQLLKMLELGRIGTVLENSLVFPDLVQKMGKSMLDFYLVTQKKKNMGVYFGHLFLEQHPDFLEKFNQHVQACSLLNYP